MRKEHTLDVTIYTTNCPQCKVLENILTRLKIKYVKCEDVEKMVSLGITSAPYLDVNGELMNFGKALQWTKDVAN